MLAVVCGGGGFIGGHLVASLVNQGDTEIRAVDIKPLANWHQLHACGVENLSLDLRDIDACRSACRDADVVYNFACEMGGMGFIEQNKALFCSAY